MKAYQDIDHWQNTVPPLCPNEEEVEIYRQQISGANSVCLLGVTKQLIPLCNFAVDLSAVKIEKPILNLDWNNLRGFKTDVIIGDGVLNLMGINFVDSIRPLANKFVFRVFLKKFSWMKYATHFPIEFPKSKSIIKTQEDIAIVVF